MRKVEDKNSNFTIFTEYVKPCPETGQQVENLELTHQGCRTMVWFLTR